MSRRSYEQAALHYGKDLNQQDKSVELFEKACFMYREHGVPDTAALCLDRGAKYACLSHNERD